ncbi:MAG: lambda-exonuclease family protein [Chloroherpetonaceae bacterium]
MGACLIDIQQGSEEWLNLRKTKITATDSCVIMGTSHWKTRIQLYHEKKDPNYRSITNERMQRGIELEPVARDLFCYKYKTKMEPKVIVKDWAMASLDGINAWNEILEIKCPGEKDHNLALSGKIPEHYYPQLQHQMYVCEAEKAYYFSFDGFDGVTIEVKRDDKYIEKMIEEEKKFYDCLLNNIPPELSENDYIEREDDIWKIQVEKWMSVNSKIKELELVEEQLRKELIELSLDSNTKGAGISLCKINRKGAVDYSKIPELKNIDLEKYRKSSSVSWRISYQ